MVSDPNFNLRSRLKMLGISQVRFAAMLDIDPTTVRAWVRLGTPGPTRRLVELLEYEAGIAKLPNWLLPIVVGDAPARVA